ncbi:hypothetical protein VTG60DRAFT_816 [Thermothelomyces hinnuleus]
MPFPSDPIPAESFNQNALVKPKTVLYLAYGSNMSAETFLGMRGIRPLSQVNVAAPSLELVFDLPGLPYREPCFANTALRKLPGKTPKFPPNSRDKDDAANDRFDASARRSPVWNKGLYGVVYEVTNDDYAKIVATEGGGAGYHDILVPCFVLPPSVRVPEKPAIPVPPKPFLAHTLYAPRLPNNDDNDDDDNDDNGKDNKTNNNNNNNNKADTRRPRRPTWPFPLLTPVQRPDPNYAQPSARYLKLLVDGAREHDLPHDYQAYLGALQPYTRTTRRQEWGHVLFLGFWAPLLLLVMIAGRKLADERGRSPAWVVAATTVIVNLVWMSYDCIGKRVFGDGERTMESENKDGVLAGPGTKWRRRKSLVNELRGKIEVSDEEQTPFLEGYQ